MSETMSEMMSTIKKMSRIPVMSRIVGNPTEEEEPTPGSPDVASSTLPTMNVDNLDRTVKDMILPSTVKIPSKLMEESLKSRQFVKVTRKGRKKNLHDPNSCKTN